MAGVKGMNKGAQNRLYVHGGSGTRLHKVWLSMRERCNRVHHPFYRNYGGRGIKVCDEWNDFRAFREWAFAHGYSDKLQIDRINNNGNYEPSNCRWVTGKENANNKRTNRIIVYRGKTYTLSQLAEKIGMGKTTLKERLNRGWSVESAVEKPVQKKRNKR